MLFFFLVKNAYHITTTKEAQIILTDDLIGKLLQIDNDGWTLMTTGIVADGHAAIVIKFDKEFSDRGMWN